MYEPPTAPRTIGGVLDDAFRLYRRSFLACLPFAALLSLSFWLYMTVIMPTAVVARTPVQMLAVYKSAHVLEAYGLMLVFGLLFQSAMAAVTYSISGGARLGFASALKMALIALPGGIAGLIMIMLIAVLGSLALIIPGIYLVVRLQLWLIPLVVDRANPFEALGISWDLMRGSWWRTFMIEFVLFVVIVVIFIALGFLAGIILAILIPALHLQLAGRVAGIQTIDALVYLAIWPLWIAVLVAIYRDLKLRKEGTDLAARVTSL